MVTRVREMNIGQGDADCDVNSPLSDLKEGCRLDCWLEDHHSGQQCRVLLCSVLRKGGIAPRLRTLDPESLGPEDCLLFAHLTADSSSSFEGRLKLIYDFVGAAGCRDY